VNAGPQGRLLIAVEQDPRATVVRPTGLLEVPSHAVLRDALLKCSAEEPPGIVVDLCGLSVRRAPLLSVFTAVWRRIGEWPGIPLLLAAPQPPVAALLERTGAGRFVAVHPTLEAALAAVAAPPPRRRLSARLAAEPGSAARARWLVDAACRDWGMAALRDDARLIASELVSNVLRHARGAPLLRLELAGERFVVAVADDDPNPPVPMDPPDSQPGGRGLRLVTRISTAWGYAPTAGGKITWASLRRPEPSRRRRAGAGPPDLARE
jgi:anti-anti-sigma regulatory factor/anti-sigma regulatory factor (Ser/Thr protein kinase)